jgi:hypothetical protein
MEIIINLERVPLSWVADFCYRGGWSREVICIKTEAQHAHSDFMSTAVIWGMLSGITSLQTLPQADMLIFELIVSLPVLHRSIKFDR